MNRPRCVRYDAAPQPPPSPPRWVPELSVPRAPTAWGAAFRIHALPSPPPPPPRKLCRPRRHSAIFSSQRLTWEAPGAERDARRGLEGGRGHRHTAAAMGSTLLPARGWRPEHFRRCPPGALRALVAAGGCASEAARLGSNMGLTAGQGCGWCAAFS